MAEDAKDRPAASGAPGTAWNDPKVPGLRLRYLATKAVYYLSYRTKTGKQRAYKIGDVRFVTLTAARTNAKEVLARVAKGEDPAGEKAELATRPDIDQLRTWHIERHAETKNKESWREDVKALYINHIIPHLGPKMAVADVEESHIEALHHKMRATPNQANRVAAALHKAFNLAEKWGWRPRKSNPVQVERYKERKRKRLPQADEAIRLLIALNAMRDTDPHFVGLIELLCFTGARLTEIMHARWEWVKADGLHLPDSKGGEKILPLSVLAREVLKDIPRLRGNPWIICGRLHGRHMVNVTHPWKRLMKAANITENLIRHDLRRFFASAGISGGLTLSGVGSLLGHMDPQTTKRYAFLLTGAAQKMADTASEQVKEIMTGGGKVAVLRR
ncbi:MAG: site-specific integrase [Mesorhizobium sp.]|uniref:tyrosine-type recombinase/integrase n=1 Tax=Mesorhizobium sp. TaxID=1871066 RepID=UPI001202853E|nr:site-specific integrase [Mesorhizobium sp.]TIM41726.1 MAG: site-specific integrase [Mesorhizobium sp.]